MRTEGEGMRMAELEGGEAGSDRLPPMPAVFLETRRRPDGRLVRGVMAYRLKSAWRTASDAWPWDLQAQVHQVAGERVSRGAEAAALLRACGSVGPGLSFALRVGKEAGVGASLRTSLCVRAEGARSDAVQDRLSAFHRDIRTLLMAGGLSLEWDPLVVTEHVREAATDPTGLTWGRFIPARDKRDFRDQAAAGEVGDLAEQVVQLLRLQPGRLVLEVRFTPNTDEASPRRTLGFLRPGEDESGLANSANAAGDCGVLVRIGSDEALPPTVGARLTDALGAGPSGRALVFVPDDDAAKVASGSFVLTSDEVARLLPLTQLAPTNTPILPDATLGAWMDLPVAGGALLGRISICGVHRTIRLSDADASLHDYIVGKTGTGKTTLMAHQFLDRIAEGHGAALIDPHGDLALEVARRIPRERMDDVILFDPTDVEWPIGLNLVEHDRRYPEQRSFLVDELIRIFNVLYEMRLVAGPIFESYFRNAFLALMGDPELDADVTHLARFLSDTAFRKGVLERCDSPMVRYFWKRVVEQVMGENALQNTVPYISAKLNSFTDNLFLLPIVAQARSGFDFRELMDNGKILIVRLNKGRLGALNTRLMGMLLVMRILLAALSRSELPEDCRRPFHLFVDEFQTLVTPGTAELLAEARKYKVRLTMANQNLDQVPADIRAAIFGNVGTLQAFRVGPQDAAILSEALGAPQLARDLVRLPNYRAVVRGTFGGDNPAPFLVDTLPLPGRADDTALDRIRQQSRLRHARPRAEVLAEVYARYGEKRSGVEVVVAEA